MSGSTCVLADVRGKKLRRSSRIRSINTRLSTATFSRRPLFTGHPARLATNSLRDIHQAHDHYRDFRTHRHSRPTIVDDPDILVIRRGYRVRLHGDRNAQTWEIWRSINVARLHALDYQSTQPLVSLGTVPYFSTESRHGRRTPASRRGPVSVLPCSALSGSTPSTNGRAGHPR